MVTIFFKKLLPYLLCWKLFSSIYFIFTLSFFFSLAVLLFQFYQTVFCRSLYIIDLGLWMIHSSTALIYLYCGEIALLPLFSLNHWSMQVLSDTKNWKMHYRIYLILENKRRSFLSLTERRKRIKNILKRENSFRIGNNFLEIINMQVSFYT